MTADQNPTVHPFDEAIALRYLDEGRFGATITAGWDIRGIPHGGYLLALVGAAACQAVSQPDPISISANYLKPPTFGEAEIWVEVLRAGRRQSTVSVRLVQEDLERVHAVVTVGELSDEPSRPWTSDTTAPSIPGPDDCPDIATMAQGAEEEAIGLHRLLALRLHPETGWVLDQPTGTPQLEGWLRLLSGREPDALALLMLSDAFPPSIFEATGRATGHVPTVQLTTHLFARPRPGWVQARFRSRVAGGGFVDEDGELWDGAGNLVATARQLALLR